MAASNGSDAGQLQPLLAAGGEAHAVALARQERLEDLAHDLLVVDDEDRRLRVAMLDPGSLSHALARADAAAQPRRGEATA